MKTQKMIKQVDDNDVAADYDHAVDDDVDKDTCIADVDDDTGVLHC